MATTLLIFLPLLYIVGKDPVKYGTTTFTVRKLFHLLAVILFIPAHIKLLYHRSLFTFLAVAHNMVTPTFIMIEITRATFQDSALGSWLNSGFLRFVTDKREVPSKVLLTHLYLLIGLGLPVSVTFIILDGGFVNTDHAYFSVCSVIFLGIGDSAAAIYGRMFG